jgi:hypothetical protein
MRTRLALCPTLLIALAAGCTHTREPMGEGCIDGVVRAADLTFQADSSGREYVVLAGDEGSHRLDLRPYAGQRITVCGPVGPHFHILHARIIPSPPPR